MNNRFEQGSLELEVSNFGPIVNAKIELRPLTVFIGPSNTGKSYLAILIYALHRHFNGGRWLGHRSIPMGFRVPRRDGFTRLPRKTSDFIKEFLEKNSGAKGKSLSEEGAVLPEALMNIIRSELGEQGDGLGREVARCFGFDDSRELIRKHSKGGAHVDFRRKFSNKSPPVDHRLSISRSATQFKSLIQKAN